MRKIVVGVLIVGVLIMGYFTYNVICDNKHVKDKIGILNNNIIENEKSKEIYESRKNELDEIKEKNKEKASKYDEVEAWNQEIIKYLD